MGNAGMIYVNAGMELFCISWNKDNNTALFIRTDDGTPIVAKYVKHTDGVHINWGAGDYGVSKKYFDEHSYLDSLKNMITYYQGGCPSRWEIDNKKVKERINWLKNAHEFITLLNNENAYYDWIVEGVPDCPSENDFEFIASNEDSFNEVKDYFFEVFYAYRNDGLMKPDNENMCEWIKENRLRIEIVD